MGILLLCNGKSKSWMSIVLCMCYVMLCHHCKVPFGAEYIDKQTTSRQKVITDASAKISDRKSGIEYICSSVIWEVHRFMPRRTPYCSLAKSGNVHFLYSWVVEAVYSEVSHEKQGRT